MNTIKVTVEYNEGKRHSIVETWTCSGMKTLKKTLAQALDTAVDEKGMPTEPDRARLEESFISYGGKDFVDSEYKRMKKAYKVYRKLVDDGIFPNGTSNPVKIDSRTAIKVELCD